MVRSSVRPEAGRRQAQRDKPSERVLAANEAISEMDLGLVFVVASMMVIGGAFGVIVYTHPVHAVS